MITSVVTMFRALMGSKIFWYGIIVAIAAWAFSSYRDSLIEMGYDKRVAEEKDQRLVEQAESIKQYALMADTVKGAQDAYEKQGNVLIDLRERLRLNDQRLLAQRTDFERKLKTASAESLRKYAEASDRNFDGCREHIARFGLEAASCARTAEALKKNLDTITEK